MRIQYHGQLIPLSPSLLILLSLTFLQCTSSPANQKAAEETQEAEVQAPKPDAPAEKEYDGTTAATEGEWQESTQENVEESKDEGMREPTDEEIHEYGIVKNIEDGPYPMFIVSMEFPERQFSADFNLNIESVSLDVTQLYEALGKYATIYYTSEMELGLHDIQYEGSSLYGAYAPSVDDSYKKIIGTLNGAESESGDLPSEISVTDANGNSLVFKEFVTEEHIKVNGKEVTAYYYVDRGIETITFISISEE